MSYTINLTNGTILTSVVDGSIDQTATDITLIGKNASSYGTYINDNFVWLLENFANSSQPNHPITGQLWFDTTENRLKVYDGSAFKVSGGTIVSPSVPSGITTGDIWINSTTEQLFFNDGLQTVLAGPIYSSAQGVSGFVAETVLDTNNISHTIVLLYVSQTLIGIFSKNTFTPASAIAGYTGDISVGFNVANTTGIKFNVPVSSSYALIAPDGSLKTTASFLSTSGSSSINGTLSIQNASPLILGANASTEINVSPTLFNIKSNSSNQNFQVSTLVGSTVSPAIFVNGTTQRVGIFTDTPSSTLEVSGDVTISGALTVLGSTTTINTTNVEIEDKLIELGKVDTPTDTTANGGGISLAGATSKTITWQQSNSAWTSSENVNLASGKKYYVNGFEVLSQTAIGPTVTSASGITSIGNLTNLTAGHVYISNGTIATNSANENLILAPNGAGQISANSTKIINLASPDSGDLPTVAATKGYVDASTKTAAHGIALTTTNFTNTQIASGFITTMFPVSEHQNTAIVRAFCTDLGTTETISAGSFVVNKTYMIVSAGSTSFNSIGAANNNPGTIFVATDVGSGNGTASPVIREYQLITGYWTYQDYL
jgi:hypothetical protein